MATPQDNLQYRDLRNHCDAWWETFRKQLGGTSQGKSDIIKHLKRACKAYDELHFIKFKRSIGEEIKKWSPAGTPADGIIADEILFYFFYCDLALRLNEEFARKPDDLPENWGANFSPHYEKLIKPKAEHAGAVISGIYVALNYIHTKGPRGLALELENYIREVQDSLHAKLRDTFSCEKVALLMVLNYWYEEYKHKNSKTDPVKVYVEAKTRELPLSLHRSVLMRITLRKDQPILWKEAKIIVKSLAANDMIEFVVPPSSKKSALIGKDFGYTETNWTAEVLNIPIGLKLASSNAQPDSLAFSIAINVDKESQGKQEIHIVAPNMSIKPQYNLTPSIDRELLQNKHRLRQWHELCLQNIIDSKHAECLVLCLAYPSELEGFFPPAETICNTIMNKSSNFELMSSTPDKLTYLLKEKNGSPREIKIKQIAAIDEVKNIKPSHPESHILILELKQFFQQLIQQVHIDEEALDLLSRYFAALHKSNVPDQICKELVLLLENNEHSIAYIDKDDVEKAWDQCNDQIMVELKAAKLSDLHKKVLKALSLALEPESDSAEVSEISKQYTERYDEFPAETSIILTLDELKKAQWVRQEGFKYQFVSLAHRKYASEYF